MSNMYFLKIAWIGDDNSRKSTLLRQIPSIRFQSSYFHTVGSDFAIKTVFVRHEGERIPIKLALWDMNPSPLFREIRALFYRGCSGGIVLFDVHLPASLESITQWVNELITFSGMNDIPILLLGMDYYHSLPSSAAAPSCTNVVSLLDELLNQLRASYPQVSFRLEFLSSQNHDELEHIFEHLIEDVLARLDDPTSEIILTNQAQRPLLMAPFPGIGHGNTLQQMQGNFRHHASDSQQNVLLLNENDTFRESNLGLNISKVGTEYQDSVPILQVKPLYQCALHRERLIPSPTTTTTRRLRWWYQCRTCEALLCEECHELILQNFDGECPNTNWPHPHHFDSKRLSP